MMAQWANREKDFLALAEKLKAGQGKRFNAETLNLSADIYEALGYQVIRSRRRPGGVAWRYRGNGPLGAQTHWCKIQDFAGSIDDALELVNRLIGQGILDIVVGYETASPGVYPAASIRWWPATAKRERGDWHAATMGAATVPLALMATLFEALPRLDGGFSR